MSKIVWITEDSFVDCDIIPIGQVSKIHNIEWIVVFPHGKTRYNENEITQLFVNNQSVTIHFFYDKYSARDLRRPLDFWKLGTLAKRLFGDVYYVNYSVALPWYVLFWRQLPRDKRIITAHQGEVHIGMKNKWLANLSRDLVYHKVTLVNMFSLSQAELFKKRYKNVEIEVINLCLKDYGKPSIERCVKNVGNVNFLSFGIINYAKNIDLLIDAACSLYEKGVRGFKVIIYGKCHNWSFYESRIRYPDLFETGIGFVNNEDIPNLFTKAHYFVQPYRVVSQSGAMKVAFQYTTPVIASNLPGLTDELEDGTNGFVFEAGNVRDLERVMKDRIMLFQSEYSSLCTRMKQYTDKHYSSENIGKKYLIMIDKILNK